MKECSEVKQIAYADTKPFILGIHYAKRMPCVQYAFGLFVDNVLSGVVTYGQPASPSLCKGVAGEENRRMVIELNRLVLLPELNGKNYGSHLVGKSLSMLPRGLFVVSYADFGGWGHIGYVYQATNWLYTGLTKPRTDKYSESGHSRHYNANETRRQNRTAKHRYIYLTGKRKSQLRQLRYEVISKYPKGDSLYYNVNVPSELIEKEQI